MRAFPFLALISITFLVSVLKITAGKTYRDVLTQGRKLFSIPRHSIHLPGWLPDSNFWNDQIYPYWRINDIRWKHCWKGGKVVAHLTNDGPTLVGANVTFAVMLRFPRCQKEDDNGDIIYDSNCKTASSFFRGQYVYNWTSWIDDYGWFNCTKFTKCNVFPDGHPFLRHTEWRRKNFIYIWHTQGQYFQQTGGSKIFLSINTANISLADHMMELSVYRKNHRGKNKYIPITTASDPYTVTDKIPIFVTISQKNKVKSNENIYIKNLKMLFNVKIQDPSNYLKKAAITYRWNFDDGNESVSKVRTATHNYTMLGQYSPTLIVEAIIPVACSSIKTTIMNPTTTTTPNPTTAKTTPKPATTPEATTTAEITTTPTTSTTKSTTTPVPTTPPNSTSTQQPTNTSEPTGTMSPATNSTTGSPMTKATEKPMQLERKRTPCLDCRLYRYGYYKTNITIVDGIVEMKIVQMTSVQVVTQPLSNSMVDFVVTCNGSIPTDVCTVIADKSCMVPKSIICDSIKTADMCHFTLRRGFNQSGIYCVNITLSDHTSLAVASTVVSVKAMYSEKTTVWFCEARNDDREYRKNTSPVSFEGTEFRLDVISFTSSSNGTRLQTILILGACLVVLIIAVAGLFYRHYKEYTPVVREENGGQRQMVVNGENRSVYFNSLKAVLFTASDEKSPLLNNAPAIN